MLHIFSVKMKRKEVKLWVEHMKLELKKSHRQMLQNLHYTIGGPVEQKITYAMSDSLGFGGHNACIAFKRMEE